MFKRFMLYLSILLITKLSLATDLFDLVSESVIENESTLTVIRTCVQVDKDMRQQYRKRRHGAAIASLPIATDIIKYVVLPYDCNPTPRLVDIKNQEGKIAADTIGIPLVLSPERLAKRRKIKNMLKKFTNDPEYK